MSHIVLEKGVYSGREGVDSGSKWGGGYTLEGRVRFSGESHLYL